MKLESIFSDIWLTAIWGPLFVGIILFLINKRFTKNSEVKTITFKHVREVVIRHVVKVEERKTPVTTTQSQSSNIPTAGSDNSTPIVLGLGLLLLSFFYAKYKIEVAAVVLGFSTFILTFVIFTVLFVLHKGIAHDRNWNRYLFTTSLLAFLGYPLMYIALNPIYAPHEVIHMSSTITKYGLTDLVIQFGIEGIVFLMSQTVGFVILATAMLLQILSLTFYTLVTQLAIADITRSPHVRFIVQALSKFRSPNKMMTISIVFYILSFFLISGIGLELWYSATNY
ncbi:MAG: hypothetical protein AB2810_21230 [Candidatus Thiodiazotropha endolucinida]